MGQQKQINQSEGSGFDPRWVGGGGQLAITWAFPSVSKKVQDYQHKQLIVEGPWPSDLEGQVPFKLQN